MDLHNEQPRKIYSFLLEAKFSKPKLQIKWERDMGDSQQLMDWKSRYRGIQGNKGNQAIKPVI